MPHVGLRADTIPAAAGTEPFKKVALNAIQAFSGNPSVVFYSSRGELHIIRDTSPADGEGTSVTQPSFSDMKLALKIFDPPTKVSPNAEVWFSIPESKRFELMELESIASHVADRSGRQALIWFCGETWFRAPPEEGPLYYLWFSAMNAD